MFKTINRFKYWIVSKRYKNQLPKIYTEDVLCLDAKFFNQQAIRAEYSYIVKVVLPTIEDYEKILIDIRLALESHKFFDMQLYSFKEQSTLIKNLFLDKSNTLVDASKAIARFRTTVLACQEVYKENISSTDGITNHNVRMMRKALISAGQLCVQLRQYYLT
jgi:hypothetical protein